jgi:hypothetical protein
VRAVEASDFTDSSGDARLGDWRFADSLYRQLSALKKGDKGSVAALLATTDQLAEAIARVFASYEAREPEFLVHLREMMVEIDGIAGSERERFRRLYKDESLNRFEVFMPAGNERKPRPKPFEAAVETVRRITDLNRIRGSLSFGRFFTIYGNLTAERASDIDLVVVLQHYNEIEGLAKALGEVRGPNGEEFIDRDQLAEMERRARAFTGLERSDLPMFFQQKLDLWEETKSEYFDLMGTPIHYRLAVHVLSPDDFDHITLREFPRFSSLPSDPLRVRVYRNDEPSSEVEDQFSFSGRHQLSQVEKEEVAEGHLATVQVCALDEGRFYPGVHLNLMFPQFEVRWESPEIRARLPLQALRYKFIAQLEDERQRHPREVHELSFAHARSHQFARRVTQRLNGA